MSNSAARLLLLAVGLLLWVCSAAAGGLTRLEARCQEGVSGVLELQAAPLRTMTVIPLLLQLRDAGGQPLAGARVACDLDMPAMPMPLNRPRIQPRGEAYQGIAVFTMAGEWTATFVVDLPGGKKAELVFAIDEVLLK